MAASGIEHLDFEPAKLLCECVGCPGHDGDQCAAVAGFRVVVHAVNRCSQVEGGTVVALLCAACMTRRARQALDYGRQLEDLRERYGRPVVCSDCGAELSGTGAFWNVQPLADLLGRGT